MKRSRKRDDLDWAVMKRSTAPRFVALALLYWSGAAFATNDPVQELHLSLTCESYVEWSAQRSIAALPLFRVFDGQGRQIWELIGYGGDFRERLEAALETTEPDSSQRSLAAELRLTVDLQGQPVESSPTADFTFTKYWADWCKPCHLQTEDLALFFKNQQENRDGTRITLLHIEADISELCKDP